MKILLADDDSKIHIVVQLWLNRNGHDVDNAQNGREALAQLQQQHYDVLIADVNMPLMNGVELVRAALELPDTPALIMVLTSRCDTAELKREIGSDRVHLFNKPFSPQALIDMIEELSAAPTD